MNVEQIINILEADKFENYGLRVMMRNPTTREYPSVEVGGSVRNSHHWNDGESLENEIDGVCAIEIINRGREADKKRDTQKAIYYLKDYIYTRGGEPNAKQVVLLGSVSIDNGNDTGEIIMEDPTVLAVWDI